MTVVSGPINVRSCCATPGRTEDFIVTRTTSWWPSVSGRSVAWIGAEVRSSPIHSVIPRWFIAWSWAPRATAATSLPTAGPCAARRAARCPPTAPAPKTTTRIVPSSFTAGPSCRASHAASALLRGRREGGKLADVAHVVLDDEGRLQVRDDLLHALDRGDRRGAVEVEDRHAVTVVVLAEVDQVAAEQHRAHVLQLHQQAGMARRVTRHPENDHAAVAEHVLVSGQRLDLPAFADPALEAGDID